MNKLARWGRVGVFGVALSLGAGGVISEVWAASVGEEAPDARVEDADERALWLSELKGSPVVVFYEDKDSGSVNTTLKDELAELMGEEGMGGIRVVPVADVADYNSWPKKSFVRKAIREASKKAGLTIYCDWDGSFRRKLDLERNTSNVVVIGRDGVVRFSATGALGEGKRAEVLALLKKEAKASK